MAVRPRIRAVAFGATSLCGLAGPVAAAPDSRVTVNFLAPERDTDASDRSGSGPGLKGTLSEIGDLLADAALRVMVPGETLRVDVLDIDLAGVAHPGFATPTGPRWVGDATPPAFRLCYELRGDGRRIASDEERVTDINFLFGARASRSGPFAHEGALLRDRARRRLSRR